MLRKFDESLLLQSRNGYGHAEEEEDNEDVDPMLGGRKSSVLRTLRAARESVREIYRPVTPIGSRSLFSIDQYSDRPESSHNRSVFSKEASSIQRLRKTSSSGPATKAKLKPIRRPPTNLKPIVKKVDDDAIVIETLTSQRLTLDGSGGNSRSSSSKQVEESQLVDAAARRFERMDVGAGGPPSLKSSQQLAPSRPKTAASTRARSSVRRSAVPVRPKSARQLSGPSSSHPLHQVNVEGIQSSKVGINANASAASAGASRARKEKDQQQQQQQQQHEFAVVGTYQRPSSSMSTEAVGFQRDSEDVREEVDEKFVEWRTVVEQCLVALNDLRASQIDSLLLECDRLHSLVDKGMNQLEWTRWLAMESQVFADDKTECSVTMMEAILRTTMHVMNRETVLEPEVTLFLKTACINLKLCMGNESSFALKPSLQSLFYLSKRPQNDSAFRRERVISPLLNYLRALCIRIRNHHPSENNGDATGDSSASLMRSTTSGSLDVLVFVAGILKNIANDEGNQKAFVRSGAVTLFFDVLQVGCNVSMETLHSSSPTGMALTVKNKWAQLCVQLTSLARTMIHTGAVLKLFSDDLMHECLAKILLLYVQHHELTFNITRIFSKLTVDEPWSEFIGENELTLQALIEVIKLYQLHYDVLIRALFALGSITMYNGQAQDVLCTKFDAQKILISLVTTYVRKLRSTSSPSREKMRLTKQLGRNEKEIDNMDTVLETSEPLTVDIIADVLSKVLCIIANLSMHSENGQIFAGNKDLAESLQYIISSSTMQNEEELILNVISVLSNISFYQGEGDQGENYVLDMCGGILSHIVPCLFSENVEIVIQATRIFSNYSRVPKAREFMHREYMIEKLAYLLSHVHLNVACSAVGPLINLFSNATKETAIIGQQIESKIIDVLERLTTENNGESLRHISPTCKALFNARHAQKTWDIPFSEENTKRFMDFSEELENLKDCTGDSWSVAQNLMELVDQDI